MGKIVVIGAVAAGLKAAAKAKRCDPAAQITVVEKGSLISYGACGLPYYVAGDVADLGRLSATAAGEVRDIAYFKNVKGIDVLTESLATKIDRAAKTVTVKNLSSGREEALPYDKLVIATGAEPVMPNLPGVKLENIFRFWYPDDARAIRAGLEKGRFQNAVIVGAGLIGIEMAEALSLWEVRVTLVEMKEQIFPAILDKEIAEAVAKYLEEKGITVLTGEKVARFNGTDALQEVVTDKRVIAADLVIMAAGVRPNVELARSAGLAIGETGAIAVDEYLTTSDPDIYAGGDCVENIHRLSGKKVFLPMGSTANKHGRIIGVNLCGGREKFGGVLGTALVKVLDMNVGRVGLTEAAARELGCEIITVLTAGHDRPHYMPAARLISVKLIVDVRSRKLLGAQAFGEGEVAKRIDVLATAMNFGATVDDLFAIDLGYAPPYSSPIDNAAVAATTLMNKLEGRFKGISPLAAKELLDAGTPVFVDVRTPQECKQSRLDSSGNIRYIPLGQLRQRLNELGRDDEIVAFCKISLRGYEAALILEGEGFDNVKVLEGGLQSWPFPCEK
ncbi:MAG: FAD-dependent oxidoreductase [Negativicutes bacterium]|nr:FAD-dependent oxidoreductase [Negativicutes bacterium]